MLTSEPFVPYASSVIVIALIVGVLASNRLAEILVREDIMLPLRRYILTKSGERGWLTRLIHCTSCTGFWTSALIMPPTIFLSLPIRWWWLAAPAVLAANRASNWLESKG